MIKKFIEPSTDRPPLINMTTGDFVDRHDLEYPTGDIYRLATHLELSIFSEHREHEDILGFIAQFEENNRLWRSQSEVYKAYVKHSLARGGAPKSRNIFYEELEANRYKKRRVASGNQVLI